MSGLSLDQVRVLLWSEWERSGDARLLAITGERLRQWVRRGHVKRCGAGYDAASLLRLLVNRYGVSLDLSLGPVTLSRTAGAELCPQVAESEAA